MRKHERRRGILTAVIILGVIISNATVESCAPDCDISWCLSNAQYSLGECESLTQGRQNNRLTATCPKTFVVVALLHREIKLKLRAERFSTPEGITRSTSLPMMHYRPLWAVTRLSSERLKPK